MYTVALPLAVLPPPGSPTTTVEPSVETATEVPNSLGSKAGWEAATPRFQLLPLDEYTVTAPTSFVPPAGSPTSALAAESATAVPKENAPGGGSSEVPVDQVTPVEL